MNEKEQSREMLFSRKALLVLIWPLFLERVLSVSMGLMDTLMVSGVSQAAVSGVSLVDTLNILVLQVLTALSTGGAVVSSQYIGKKDLATARRSVAQLYTVVLIGSGVVTAGFLLGAKGILRLIFGSVEPDVMAAAHTYFVITALSVPFVGLYNAGAALFRSQGNSRISMLASLVMNIINVAGNALLIYGFHMEVLGAAVATLLGRMAAAVWIVWQQQRKTNPYRVSSPREMVPERGLIRRILAIGIPAGLENGMFQIGKLSVSSLVSTLSTAAIAANAVANTITTVSNIPGDTMSLASIPVIGRCLGAGEKEQARHYARWFMGLAMAAMAVTNIALFFGIPYIARLFKLSLEAQALCVTVIRWFNVFAIFFWVFSFTLPNVLRCGGDATFTMWVSMASMWICRVVLSYFFVLRLDMGLLGVWLGMFLDWVIRATAYFLRFLSGKWTEHQVV